MASNMKAVKLRIKSVQSTMQITKENEIIKIHCINKEKRL